MNASDDPAYRFLVRDMRAITLGKLAAAITTDRLRRELARVFPQPQGATPMTDTIPPLTEADVKALGFTPFGYERDDRMGGSLAHKDGEAWYLCRRGSFYSVDPEYSNMRGVLCEEPPNWRHYRRDCAPYDYMDLSHNDSRFVGYDVIVWRVSVLPADRVERLFNHDQIAPVLAGLKAQAEVGAPQNAIGIPGGHWDIISGSAPTKRRPLVVGDRIIPMYGYGERATPETLDVVGVYRGVLFNGIETQIIETLEGLFTDSAVILLPREGE